MNKTLEGKITIHKKGFGFIKTEDKQDFFVPKKFRNSSIDLDIVEFQIAEVSQDPKGKSVARVTKVIQRTRTHLVALCDVVKGRKEIIPDDNRINEWIKVDNFRKLKEGWKILFEIIEVDKGTIHCKLVNYIGKQEAIGMDVKSLVASFGVVEGFPIEASQAAVKIPNEVLPEEKAGRVDLTNETIITIDGAKAKDLDDAIRVEKLDNGNYLLGVYIADVSHYVKEGKEIDLAAYERATSIYLADRVIPMLPENLSNGICSLNPQVERLTMACEMEIDAKGHVVDSKIFKAVIKTNQRMTYSDVNKIYQEDKELINKYKDIHNLLINAQELSGAIEQKKIKAGMLDFDIDESEIVVDKNGKAIDVVLKPRGFSEKMIEQFMVCANETVATRLEELKLTSIYRVHGNPPLEKLSEFYNFARHFGKHFEAKQKDIQPKDIQGILNLYKEEPYFFSIAVQVLRSMDKAVYSEENIGHFGLASKSYAHFTSPIRRYPDLILHRLINDYLLSDSPQRASYWKKNIPSMAAHTSDRERRAIDIERATLAMKKAEWAKDNINREFEAQIVTLIDFGMFVKIPNGVEGLIHISDLYDDDYVYDDVLFAIIGNKDKRKFKPGEKLKVFIKNANKETGKVDFGLVEFKEATLERMKEWESNKK